MKMLRDIAAGTVKLDDGNIESVPARPGAILIDGQDKIFGRDKLQGY